MPARVAILIPAYNSARTIAEALDSLQQQLSQARTDVKVYLTDDGSKDDTVAVARKTWQAPVPLRIIIRERNLGQWPNKNAALAEIATDTDWVLILHADDTVRREWLSVLLDRISRCPDTVGTISTGWKNLEIQNPVPGAEDQGEPAIRLIKGTPESVRGALLKGCWWLISGCAIRLAAFQDVGPFDNRFRYGGDYDWFLRCLNKGWDVEFVDKNLTFRRHHATSVAGQSLLRHVDIRDYTILYNRYASVLSLPEIFGLHGKACMTLLRRMVRSILNRNMRRFLGAWGTLFWIVSELPMAVVWPRIRLRQVR
ncbi:MAG: glycosyltransferase family 2 protein [Acidobacteriia bacterium]|nr:glycosyltransferase family 2 protein [Terriglobia bacterium]